MEKTETETSKSTAEACSFKFPPHRKSHLKSATYRSLVRILSACYGHQIPPHRPTQEANDSNESEQASEREVVERNVLVDRESMDHNKSPTQNGVFGDENFETIGFQDREFSDTQMVIDDVMRIEEDEDLLVQKDPMVTDGDCNNRTGLQNEEFSHLQQLLIDELELVIKGNEEPVLADDCNHVIKSLDDKQSGVVVALLSNQEQHSDPQPVVLKECSNGGQKKGDDESCGQNILETFGSSFNGSMTREVSRPSECNEDKDSQYKKNELAIYHEIQQKETAPDIYMIENGEIEEGELSCEFEVDDRSVVLFTKDALLSEKKVGEKQVSEKTIYKDANSLIGKNEATRSDSGPAASAMNTIDSAKNDRLVKAKESVVNDTICKRKLVVYGDPILADEVDQHKEQNKLCGAKRQKKGCSINEQKKGIGTKEQKKLMVAKHGIGCAATAPNDLAICGGKADQNSVGNLGIATEKQLDTGPTSKKKRGPPSEARKAKKKQKERKKRAEKNRELGVKWLKLLPVLKPKPVSYCRHFIAGRCHEGEKCKFSHDTIPLTKSKPCHHFARHSCMKGENCPFDHQLSKYPCNNYMSKGHCSRGENCMFSHKLPLMEDIPSASNVCIPHTTSPSLPGTSTSNEQLDNIGASQQTSKALSNSMGGITFKSPGKNVAKCEPNPPAVTPKGIGFLSSVNSPVVDSKHPKLATSSMKRNEGVKVGSQTDQVSAGTVQNSKEIKKGTTPVIVPKGINFLSFGKVSMDNPSAMKLNSLHVNQPEGALSNNLSVHKQYYNVDNSIPVGKEAIPVESTMLSSLNPMRQKSELPDSSSSHEASADGSKSNPLANLLSSLGGGADKSVQASKTSSDKHPNFSASPTTLLASPLGSGKSSDHLSHMFLKNTPNSAQKALMSTLAFAAKVESETKRNRSTIGSLAASNGASSSSGVLKSDSAKASKILDFLSGVGKTKQ